MQSFKVLALVIAASFAVMPAYANDGKTEGSPVKPTTKDHPLEDGIFSGFRWTSESTKALQNDEFENPGLLWNEIGEGVWNKKEGEAGKSCASCHNDASTSMKGVGARYPIYYKPWKKMINLEQRINECRKNQMKAKPLKWKSNNLLGITIYVNRQSLGMPQNVVVNDENKAFFTKGKEHYYKRRGQFDMACSHCHEDHFGEKIRANILTQGHINGFPVYRMKWQKPGSTHRRFKGCNKQVRAKPFKIGSDEYTNLEFYVRWRGQGLPMETPAVRN